MSVDFTVEEDVNGKLKDKYFLTVKDNTARILLRVELDVRGVVHLKDTLCAAADGRNPYAPVDVQQLSKQI